METLHGFILSLEKKGRYNITDIMECYRKRRDSSKLLGYIETLAKDLERQGQCRTANAYRTVSKGLVEFNNGGGHSACPDQRLSDQGV